MKKAVGPFARKSFERAELLEKSKPNLMQIDSENILSI